MKTNSMFISRGFLSWVLVPFLLLYAAAKNCHFYFAVLTEGGQYFKTGNRVILRFEDGTERQVYYGYMTHNRSEIVIYHASLVPVDKE